MLDLSSDQVCLQPGAIVGQDCICPDGAGVIEKVIDDGRELVVKLKIPRKYGAFKNSQSKVVQVRSETWSTWTGPVADIKVQPPRQSWGLELG